MKPRPPEKVTPIRSKALVQASLLVTLFVGCYQLLLWKASPSVAPSDVGMPSTISSTESTSTPLAVASSSSSSSSSIKYQKVDDGTIGGRPFAVYAAMDKMDHQPMTVLQWTKIMAVSSPQQDGITELVDIIRQFPHEGVYFETPGVTSANASTKPFRFCLVDGKRLADFAERRASPQSFQEHFDACQNPHACQFQNLGGDATLVAPQKLDATKDTTIYSHLMAFTRHAPKDQVYATWKHVATTYQTILQTRQPTRPVWLSKAFRGFIFDSMILPNITNIKPLPMKRKQALHGCEPTPKVDVRKKGSHRLGRESTRQAIPILYSECLYY